MVYGSILMFRKINVVKTETLFLLGVPIKSLFLRAAAQREWKMLKLFCGAVILLLRIDFSIDLPLTKRR